MSQELPESEASSSDGIYSDVIVTTPTPWKGPEPLWSPNRPRGLIDRLPRGGQPSKQHRGGRIGRQGQRQRFREDHQCGRGVMTVQDINGNWVFEIYSEMAATDARREQHRQAGL